jgi:hypothetical protein
VAASERLAVGAVLDVAGAGMLGLAFRITRGYRRKRTRQAAATGE